jgi:hypothetical protein
MLLGVIYVIFMPLLVGIYNDKNNNQWSQKPIVLVKAIGKGRINTRRVDGFNPLISPIHLPEAILVVGAAGMVTPHLGRNENCLFMSKRKRILVLKLNRNCLRQNSKKGLRLSLVSIVVTRVILSFRLVLSQGLPNY